MGTPGKPDEALLFVAFSFQKTIAADDLQKIAVEPFGSVLMQSEPFAFAYSHYYTAEMGTELEKIFVVYEHLFPIEKAVQTKLKAIRIEERTAIAGRRTINIDPGYLTLAKLVLTTTKNFDHRIHIGSGVFADVQLRFRHGEYVASPWTYPDYREFSTYSFLKSALTHVHHLVKQHAANL